MTWLYSALPLLCLQHVELKRAIRKEDMRPGQSMTEAAALPRQQRVNHSGKPLDWQCPECHNKNYGWRTECNRCKASCGCAAHLCKRTCCEARLPC